jgi:hypothetical protein
VCRNRYKRGCKRIIYVIEIGVNEGTECVQPPSYIEFGMNEIGGWSVIPRSVEIEVKRLCQNREERGWRRVDSDDIEMNESGEYNPPPGDEIERVEGR